MVPYGPSIKILLFSFFIAFMTSCSGKETEATILFVKKIENGYLFVLKNQDSLAFNIIENGNVYLIKKISSKKSISKPTIDLKSKQIYYAELDSDNNRSVIKSIEYGSLGNTNHKEKNVKVDFLVTEIASLGNDKLMFLGAQEYAGYSPTSVAYPHMFDLYFFDLNHLVLEKRTNLKSYTAHSLQIIDSSRVSFLTDLRWINTVAIYTNDNLVRTDLKLFSNDKFFSPSSYYYEDYSDELLIFSNYRFYLSSNNGEFNELPLRVNNQVQLLSYDSKEQSILFIENNDNKIKTYDITKSKIIIRDEL